MTISFSGLSSGIDTQSIISALVSVEGAQQTLLQNQQTTKQKTVDAYASLISKLNSLSTAATTVADTASWVGTTASSSSSSVTATATGSTAASLTFNVVHPAAAHTVISADSVGSTSDIVASGGSISISQGSATTSLDVGTGTLGEVISAINSSDTGLVASAVRVSSGAYRLQVAARTTGESTRFDISGLTGFTALNTLTTGADALIHVGDSSTGFDASSTTNTFSDLVAGLSFTVSRPEDGVTVSSAVDGSAVAKTVSGLVDAANSVLAYIDTATAWSATTKTASPLNGESSVRSLQQNILGMVSLAGVSGVSLDRDGRLSFDQTSFLSAFSADPAKVAAQFGASASFSRAPAAQHSSLTFSSSTDTTRAGSYAVHITQAAAREQWSLAVTGGTIAGQTVSVTQGSVTVTYAAAADEDLTTSIAGINRALANAGASVAASASGGNLLLTASSAGSSGAFSTSLAGVSGSQLVAGQDVAGSIAGQVATGRGNVLSLATGTGGAVGLSLVVDTTAADLTATGGDIGQINYSPGLAGSLQQLVSSATDSTAGTLTSGQKSATSQVKDLQDQIDRWTQRLADYRARLVAQFTAMETSINTLKNSLSALSGLLNSTSSSSSSTSSSSG